MRDMNSNLIRYILMSQYSLHVICIFYQKDGPNNSNGLPVKLITKHKAKMMSSWVIFFCFLEYYLINLKH